MHLSCFSILDSWSREKSLFWEDLWIGKPLRERLSVMGKIPFSGRIYGGTLFYFVNHFSWASVIKYAWWHTIIISNGVEHSHSCLAFGRPLFTFVVYQLLNWSWGLCPLSRKKGIGKTLIYTSAVSCTRKNQTKFVLILWGCHSCHENMRKHKWGWTQ